MSLGDLSAPTLETDPHVYIPPLKAYSEWSSTTGSNIADPLSSYQGYADYQRSHFFRTGEIDDEVEQAIQHGFHTNLLSSGVTTPEELEKPEVAMSFMSSGSSDEAETNLIRRAFGEEAGATYLQNKQSGAGNQSELNNQLNMAKTLLVDAGHLSFASITDDQGRTRVIGGSDIIDRNKALDESVRAGALNYSHAYLAADGLKQGVTENSTRFQDRQRADLLTELGTLLGSDKDEDESIHTAIEEVSEIIKEQDTAETKDPQALNDYVGAIRAGLSRKYGEKNGLSEDAALIRYSDKQIRQALEEKVSLELNARKGFKFYDDDDTKNIRILSSGLAIAHPSLMDQRERFEQAVEKDPRLTQSQRTTLRNSRKYFREQVYPHYDKILSETSATSDEWLEAKQAGRVNGVPDTDTLDAFLSDKDNYSSLTNRAGAIGASVWDGIAGMIAGVGAVVFKSEGATEYLVEAQRDRARRREVAALFGDDFGWFMDLGEAVAPMVADVAATGVLSAASFGAGGVAYISLKTGARVSARGLTKSLSGRLLRKQFGETAEQAAKNLVAKNLIMASTEEAAVKGAQKAIVAYNKALGSRFWPKAATLPPLFLTSANRSAGGTYATVYAAQPDNMTHAEKHDAALGYALMSGMTTGLITTAFSAFGRGGLEDALLRGMSYKNTVGLLERVGRVKFTGAGAEELNKSIRDTISSKLKEVTVKRFPEFRRAGKAGLYEALEEGADEFAQTFIMDAALNQDTPMIDRVMIALHASSIGGALGAGAVGVRAMMDRGSGSQYMMYEQQVVDDVVAKLRETDSPLTAMFAEEELGQELRKPFMMAARSRDDDPVDVALEPTAESTVEPTTESTVEATEDGEVVLATDSDTGEPLTEAEVNRRMNEVKITEDNIEEVEGREDGVSEGEVEIEISGRSAVVGTKFTGEQTDLGAYKEREISISLYQGEGENQKPIEVATFKVDENNNLIEGTYEGDMGLTSSYNAFLESLGKEGTAPTTLESQAGKVDKTPEQIEAELEQVKQRDQEFTDTFNDLYFNEQESAEKGGGLTPEEHRERAEEGVNEAQLVATYFGMDSVVETDKREKRRTAFRAEPTPDGMRMVISPWGIARMMAGLSKSNAQHLVRTEAYHEVIHNASWRDLSKVEIDEIFASLPDSQVNEIVDTYYPTQEQRDDSRKKLAEEEGRPGSFWRRRQEQHRIVDEFLRMKAQRILKGYTSEEELEFYRSNPNFLRVFLRYLTSVVNRMRAARELDSDNPVLSAALRRLTGEMARMKGAYRITPDIKFDVSDPDKYIRTLASQFGAATPERQFLVDEDEKYLALAENEEANQEELQRMVDERAKAAGYDVKAFHGTPDGGFVEFNTNRKSIDADSNTIDPNTFLGAHFAEDREVAQRFADELYGADGGNKPQVYGVWLKLEKPLGGNIRGSVAETKAEVEAGILHLKKTEPLLEELKAVEESISKLDVDVPNSLLERDGITAFVEEANRLKAEIAPDLFSKRDELKSEIERITKESGIEGIFKQTSVKLPSGEAFLGGDRGLISEDEFGLQKLTKMPMGRDSRAESDPAYDRAQRTRQGKSMRAGLDQYGFDSAVYKNQVEGGVGIVVANPNQIKSADPVTRDENGNVIPLSQRFNVSDADIRYSQAGAVTGPLHPTPIEFPTELLSQAGAIPSRRAGSLVETRGVGAFGRDVSQEFTPSDEYTVEGTGQFEDVDRVDVQKVLKDFREKNGREPKVWVWMGDQLKRGMYENGEVRQELGGGIGYAIDPENRRAGRIWASGLDFSGLQDNAEEADFIWIASGTPDGAHNFSKGTSKVIVAEIIQAMKKMRAKKRGKTFKYVEGGIEKSITIKGGRKKLTDSEQFDEFAKIMGRWLKAGKTPLGRVQAALESGVGLVDGDGKNRINFAKNLLADSRPEKGWFMDSDAHNRMRFIHDFLEIPTNAKLREGILEPFNIKNNIQQGDLTILLKPTGAVENGGAHDTYAHAVTGTVVGMPTKRFNIFDITSDAVAEQVMGVDARGRPLDQPKRAMALVPMRGRIYGKAEEGVEGPLVFMEEETPVQEVDPVEAEWEADYMRLAQDEEANQEELQQMVDERAEAAGYNIGYIVYRGDEKPYNELMQGDEAGNLGYGLYFTPDRDYAKIYGNPRKFYLRGNIADIQSDEVYARYEKIVEELEEIGENPDNAFDELADELGVDGFRARGVGGFGPLSEEVVVPDGSFAKLADPVTRDDAGNVIPLSQRFDKDSPDIRYSQAGGIEPDRESVTENARAHTFLDEEYDPWDKEQGIAIYRNGVRLTGVEAYHAIKQEDQVIEELRRAGYKVDTPRNKSRLVVNRQVAIDFLKGRGYNIRDNRGELMSQAGGISAKTEAEYMEIASVTKPTKGADTATKHLWEMVQEASRKAESVVPKYFFYNFRGGRVEVIKNPSPAEEDNIKEVEGVHTDAYSYIVTPSNVYLFDREKGEHGSTAEALGLREWMGITRYTNVSLQREVIKVAEYTPPSPLYWDSSKGMYEGVITKVGAQMLKEHFPDAEISKPKPSSLFNPILMTTHTDITDDKDGNEVWVETQVPATLSERFTVGTTLYSQAGGIDAGTIPRYERNQAEEQHSPLRLGGVAEALEIPFFYTGKYRRKKQEGMRWLNWFTGGIDPRVQRLVDQNNQANRAVKEDFDLFAAKLKGLVKKEYTDKGKEAPTELIRAISGSAEGLSINEDIQKQFDAQYQAEVAKANRMLANGTLTPEEAALKKKTAEERRTKKEKDARLVLRQNFDREKNAAIAKFEGGLNNPIVMHVLALRRLVNGMSNKLKELFGHDVELGATIDANMDIYLHRSYKLFTDVDYARKVLGDAKMSVEEAKHFEGVRERAGQVFRKSYIEHRTNQLESSHASREDARREAVQEVANDPTIVNGLIMDYIHSLTGGTKPLSLMGVTGSPESRKGIAKLVTGGLMKRTNPPEAIRELLGEHEDTTGYNTLLRTYMHVGLMASKQAFAQHMFDLGTRSKASRGKDIHGNPLAMDDPENKWIWTQSEWNAMSPEEKAEKQEELGEIDIIKVGGENADQFDPFRPRDKSGNIINHYAPKEMANGVAAMIKNSSAPILESEADEAAKALMSVASRLTGLSLGAKTLGSIGFYVRNVVSNLIFFGPSQGFVRFGKMGTQFKTEMKRFLNNKSEKEISAFYRTLTALGVGGNEMRARLIEDLIEKTPTEVELLGEMNKTLEEFKKAGGDKMKATEIVADSKVGKIYNKLKELSATVDVFYKIAYFLHEVETLQQARDASKKAGIDDDYTRMSDFQLMDAAAEKVKRTAQSYDQAPPFVAGAQKTWYGTFFAPFLRFKTEVPRIILNTLKLGWAEVKDSNPVIKARGAKRLGGMSSVVVGMSALIPLALRGMSGIGEEEDEALRDSMPEYLRTHTFFYFGKGKKLQSVDMTYLNPYAMMVDPFTRAFEQIARGNPAKAGAQFAESLLANNFLDEQILAGAVMDLKSNRNPKNDRPIWEENDTSWDALYKSAKFLVDSAYMPRTPQSVWKEGFVKLQEGGVDGINILTTPAGALINEFRPVRFHEVNLEQQLSSFLTARRSEYNRVISRKNKMLTDKPMDVDEIRELAIDEVEHRRRINQHISKAMRGFESLGLSNAQMFSQAKERGYGQRRMSLLFGGLMDRPSLRKPFIERMAGKGDIHIQRLRDFQKELDTYPAYISLD